MLKTVYQKIFNSFKRTELSMKLFTLFSIIIFNIPIAIYIYDLSNLMKKRFLNTIELNHIMDGNQNTFSLK